MGRLVPTARLPRGRPRRRRLAWTLAVAAIRLPRRARLVRHAVEAGGGGGGRPPTGRGGGRPRGGPAPPPPRPPLDAPAAAAVDQHAPRLPVVEAGDEGGERALAGARGPDD